jgi:predicted small lipoprotein YifL
MTWASALALGLALAGCDSGGPAEGLPPDAKFAPPKEMPSMSKPTSTAEIAKVKAAAAAKAASEEQTPPAK